MAPVRVAALDASGNTVTSYTGSISVAIGSNPSGGTLSGTTTVAVVNGVATFGNLKIDKAGNVHVPVGKASFAAKQLEDNARAVIDAVAKAKPHSVKGLFIQSCTISATMSPPVKLDMKEFSTAA